MRPATVLLPLALSLAALHAKPAEADPAPDARELALDNLLSERESLKALDAVIAEARQQDVSEQAILEARFLYHVDHRQDEAIAALLPEFIKRRGSFTLSDSAIFGVKEDWLAVVEYVQAIASLENGDKPAFKQHITEAFWLSPRQAAAFAPHIERLRLEEQMRGVKIDFAMRLRPLETGDPVPLARLVENKKALLFHFWSPWSPECEASMPDFAATAAYLLTMDIGVVSVVPGEPRKQIDEARDMIRPLSKTSTGAWLVDADDEPLARTLRVGNVPTMVLVSPDGTILFNGDPVGDGFWSSLTEANPLITRPETRERESR